MPDRILVTFASRAGSTAEVAEAIARTLTQGGAQVDVVPMNSVKDLSPYQAVVAGSAIRGSKWLPEAIQFVRTHQSMLAQKKVALFTVCITMTMKNAEKYRAGVMNWVAPVRAMVKPISEELFAGMLDFGKLPINKDTLMLRLSIVLGIFPRGDHRDWNKIQSWAQSLKPILG
jgi:menaquinone-dependent protoporphyrinogen oxidase